MALTRRQREILDFIQVFIDEHGYSPSLEEIGARFGLSSVATVHKHVQHLVEKGYLRKALAATGWQKRLCAEKLGIGFSTLKEKLKAYGINRERDED